MKYGARNQANCTVEVHQEGDGDVPGEPHDDGPVDLSSVMTLIPSRTWA
jgi:hypothetical protein